MSSRTIEEDLENDASMQAELDLLAYLDGELEGERAAAVMARLQTDRAYAARLKALEAVAGFLRSDADRIYRSGRVDTIVDDVTAKLESAKLADVIPMSQVAPPTSRLTRKKKNTVIWVAFGGIAAAAAALIFYVGRDHGTGVAPVASATTAPSPPRASSADTVAVKTPNPPPSNPPVPETASTVEVENLEVGSGATVVYTRGEEGSSPVVWITSREAK